MQLSTTIKDVIRTLAIAFFAAILISWMVGMDLRREKQGFFDELHKENVMLKALLSESITTITNLEQRIEKFSVQRECKCKCDCPGIENTIRSAMTEFKSVSIKDPPNPRESESNPACTPKKEEFLQTVFTVNQKDPLPLVGTDHGIQFHHGGNNGKIHLLGTKFDDNGQLECDQIDVYFHQSWQKGRCAMLVPDRHIRSSLISVAMQKDETTHELTPKPLKPHPRHPRYDSSLIIRNEKLSGFFSGREQMVKEIRKLVGTEDDQARIKLHAHPEALLVMCANEGHMPLLLNFMCSLKRHKIPMPKHLIFAITAELQATLSKLGFVSYYSPLLGKFDTGAAQQFGDHIFGQMMLLKQLSVHLTLDTGYDVLFQDVDITWLSNPTENLFAHSEYFDVMFQDDGSRAERFEPFYANSGFFYLRNSFASHYFWDLVTLTMPGRPRSNQIVIAPILEMLHQQRDSQQILAEEFKVKILPDDEYLAGHKITHPLAVKNGQTIKPLSETARILHFCWTNNLDDKIHKMIAYKQLFVTEGCIRNFTQCRSQMSADYSNWDSHVCISDGTGKP
eukprot:m.102551 g.102551  ORF g.102551 m.102551 type:complete len:565 (+) comp27411_c0_seq3:198-1892(+)